jgi:hypothetical protein
MSWVHCSNVGNKFLYRTHEDGNRQVSERKFSLTSATVRSSALAAVHGMRRDSLLLELKLTLKIAQEKGWPVISLRGT